MSLNQYTEISLSLLPEFCVTFTIQWLNFLTTIKIKLILSEGVLLVDDFGLIITLCF